MVDYEKQDFEDANRLVRERQFFKPRPKKTAEIIARLMARKGYGQQIAASELDDVWKNIATQNITIESWKNQTQVGNVRRGVLEVTVTTSALRQRLEFEKSELLQQLKQQLPHKNIKEIRFRIGNLDNNG